MMATASGDNPRSRRRRRARRSLRIVVASARPRPISRTSRSTKRRISARVSPVDLVSWRSRSFSDIMAHLSLPQLPRQLPQVGGERDWQSDVHLGIEVAVSFRPEPGAVLGLGRHLERYPAPLQRRHHDLTSEKGHVERHRHPKEQVVTLATESRVRPHMHAHEKVPRSTPVPPCCTLAGDANPCRVSDARWNLHLHATPSLRVLKVQRAHSAAIRLLQRERRLRFHVLAGEGPNAKVAGPPGSRALPIQIVKETGERAVRPEEILQILGTDRAVLYAAPSERCSGRPPSRLPGLVLLPIWTQLVVLLAFLGVTENLVRLVDLLELFSRA